MQRNFYEQYPITTLLLILIIGLYGIELLGMRRVAEDPENWFGFMRPVPAEVYTPLGAMNGARTLRGEFWRPVNAIFLHGSLIHVLMNLWVFYSLSRECENLLSSSKYFGIFIICGIGSSLLSGAWMLYRLSDLPEGLPEAMREQFQELPMSLGASGAIFGLIGLLLSHAIRNRLHERRSAIVRWVVFMIVFSVLATQGHGPFSNMDHAGHAGGFLAGFALGWTVPEHTTSTTALRWKYPAWALGGLVALSLSIGLYRYFGPRLSL